MPVDAELLSRSLSLPVAERADLARQLLASLEPAEVDADEAWAVEIEKRMGAMDRGESVPVDAESAIERVRQSVKRDRPR